MKLVREERKEQERKRANYSGQKLSPAMLTGRSVVLEQIQQNKPAERTAAEWLADLKVKLLALVGKPVELRTAPVKTAIGTVFAGNERYAAMHIGKDTQLLDRQEWPVEVGHGYELTSTSDGRKLVKQTPVKDRTVSTLRYVYGEKVEELAKGWAERDKGLTLSQRQVRSGPNL